MPFGTGTSVFYNNVDYRVRNDTGDTYQYRIWLEDAFGLELWPTRVRPEETATPARVVALVKGMLEKEGRR